MFTMKSVLDKLSHRDRKLVMVPEVIAMGKTAGFSREDSFCFSYSVR